MNDDELTPSCSPEAVRGALRRAFDGADKAFLKTAATESLSDGSTALCALVRGRTLDVANIGDTRAVLGRRPEPPAPRPDAPSRSMRERDWEALRVSIDHKPNLPSEQRRVEASGGFVRCINGCWRVVGPRSGTMLAISRALGNLELKRCTETPLVRRDHAEITPRSRRDHGVVGPAQVSCVPHVASLPLTPRDQCLILASDGLWDVVADAEAVRAVSDIARNAAGRAAPPPRGALPQAAADVLLGLALKRGSQDNITVVVAWLHWGG